MYEAQHHLIIIRTSTYLFVGGGWVWVGIGEFYEPLRCVHDFVQLPRETSSISNQQLRADWSMFPQIRIPKE